MANVAIFLSGPIGAGKTTLGRALAPRLSAGFIDGDDFSDPERPWYGSILQTSRAIVRAGAIALADSGAVVIAYPLNCIGWIYFRRRFAEIGARPLFVGLRASYDAIIGPDRGRDFSAAERDRIRTMIAEGYGARAFSDLVVDSDRGDFATVLDRLEDEVRRLIAR